MAILRALWGDRSDWRLRFPLRPNAPRLRLSWVGPIVLIGTTLFGWLAFKDAIGDEDNVAFALFIGSVSIILMAWSNVLATRWRALESFFGGLDRMYRWHRWFGALSVAAMWFHIQTIDDVKGIRGASKSVADSAEDLAGTAETLLYILVIISLIRWVPYRWWKWTHKLMIVPFVFASWHFHTATKPYANNDAWGRWFQALMLLGIFAWVYRVVWGDIFSRGRRHVISAINRNDLTTCVEMTPYGRPLRHRTGQFVFIKMAGRKVMEPHPFTISSHPDDPVLRVHIKELGDWSASFHQHVSIGDIVRIEGPYGRLPLFPRSPTTTVWIAGGVGITPFLGAVKDAQAVENVPHLFYAVRSRIDAPGLDELERAHNEGRIKLHLYVSQEDSRLCADDLQREFGLHGFHSAHVVMCGPDKLVRSMTKAARSMGAKHVHVEAFDIRSGVGPDLSVEIEQLVHSARKRRA